MKYTQMILCVQNLMFYARLVILHFEMAENQPGFWKVTLPLFPTSVSPQKMGTFSQSPQTTPLRWEINSLLKSQIWNFEHFLIWKTQALNWAAAFFWTFIIRKKQMQCSTTDYLLTCLLIYSPSCCSKPVWHSFIYILNTEGEFQSIFLSLLSV